MDLELVGEKDDVLRQQGAICSFSNPEYNQQLSEAMVSHMLKHNGVGLAANQVGIPARMFVMGETASNYRACFNPEIVEYLGVKQKNVEGCLSFPHLALDIERNSIILVRYNDALGNIIEDELTGLWARCFQHEFDHIEGICFDQRVSKLALNIALRKRAKTLKRIK